MKCLVVTPEETVFDREVSFVVLPLFDGEYAVGRDHTPVIGRLGAGELRSTLQDGSIERWYVEGGFVEVVDNFVTLLTNVAVPLSSLDATKAQNELDEAMELRATSDEEARVKDDKLRVARSKLRAAQKGAKITK